MRTIMKWIRENRQLFTLIVVGFFLLAGVIQVAVGIDYVLKVTTVVIAILTALSLLFWDAPAKAKLVISLLVLAGGFVVELIGVKTGLLFGDYTYSGALGYRIFGVPFTIGFTWLLVTLSAWHIALMNPKLNTLQKFLLAGFLVVMFDLVLEQFAVVYGLWAWAGNEIPLFNYISWFGISLLFFALYKWLAPKTVSSIFIVCMLPMLSIFFWLMLLIA